MIFDSNWELELNVHVCDSHCWDYILNFTTTYAIRNLSRVRDMVFNDTFNNISVISWRSVLLVEETGVPRENNRPVASHWQTLKTDRHDMTEILLKVSLNTISLTLHCTCYAIPLTTRIICTSPLEKPLIINSICIKQRTCILLVNN
jgi:hypothetical protein